MADGRVPAGIGQDGIRIDGNSDSCVQGILRVSCPANAKFEHEGEIIMSISHEDVGEDLRRIVISGRLDMPGTNSVASQLEELAAAPKKGVVVDLSALKFLASIGIRALITSAKAVQQRGGKMVLVVSDSSTVMMSLEATGVDQLIPVFKNASDAERAAVA
ncbi:MAG: STAS domain-containing protein [Gammaproteobacteria bacterium]|nr:STAS domain-containing protein [Gammaproteobacteria bacterium]